MEAVFQAVFEALGWFFLGRERPLWFRKKPFWLRVLISVSFALLLLIAAAFLTFILFAIGAFLVGLFRGLSS